MNQNSNSLYFVWISDWLVVKMYNLPTDKRNRLSKLDIFLAFVPYINFMVSISYLLHGKSRKRGLIMMGISFIVNGLCSASYKLLFIRVSDIPFLAWLDRISWELPSDWWIWIILFIVASSVVIRCFQSRKLARNWQALAKRTKLDYKPGGWLGLSGRARIAGYYRERDLLLYTYNPILINNVIDRTHLKLYVINPLDLKLKSDLDFLTKEIEELQDLTLKN